MLHHQDDTSDNSFCSEPENSKQSYFTIRQVDAWWREKLLGLFLASTKIHVFQESDVHQSYSNLKKALKMNIYWFPTAPRPKHTAVSSIHAKITNYSKHWHKCDPVHFKVPLYPNIKKCHKCTKMRASPWDFEESSHWMKFSEGRVSITQLYGRDTQRPNVTALVIRGVELLLTRDDLVKYTVTFITELLMFITDTDCWPQNQSILINANKMLKCVF